MKRLLVIGAVVLVSFAGVPVVGGVAEVVRLDPPALVVPPWRSRRGNRRRRLVWVDGRLVWRLRNGRPWLDPERFREVGALRRR